MLSHFVIEYIQDETYLKLRYFDDINLTLEVISCWGITIFFCSPRRNISVPCVVVRICALYLAFVVFVQHTFDIPMCLKMGNHDLAVTLRVHEDKSQDGVLS